MNINNIIKDYDEQITQSDNLSSKNYHNEQITKVQNFFKEWNVSRWNFLCVGFGEKLVESQDKKARRDNDELKVHEIKQMKGLNFGYYEFCYDHYAVVLSEIKQKYINEYTTIIVAPISSTYRKGRILIEKEHHVFLEHDSYIVIDQIRHIGLERINLKDTERKIRRNESTKLLFEASQKAIIDTKNSLKQIFDI